MSNRRTVIKNLIAGSALLSLGINAEAKKDKNTQSLKLKKNIKQSVCRWCYDFWTIEELCNNAKLLDLVGIDLVGPADWPTLKKHNLISTMCNGAEINLVDGFGHPQFHSVLKKNYLEHIEYVAQAGYKNLICFSGSRRGLDDETGLNNCVKGLQQILPLAEKKGVIIQMELLNSRVDHHDYMCDRSAWGIELCKRLNSPNFKLLFDIYHMQIDEGDIIRSIKKNHIYFGHYHTGGNPGRNEINNTQELYYPAIMKAIVETGFTDYVAQEFIPTWANKFDALKDGVLICDV